MLIVVCTVWRVHTLTTLYRWKILFSRCAVLAFGESYQVATQSNPTPSKSHSLANPETPLLVNKLQSAAKVLNTLRHQSTQELVRVISGRCCQ